MVRYFYSWTPLVIVGTVVLLTLPWLGLIALMVFALVVLGALAALVWAIVAAPLAIVRAVGRRWRRHDGVDRARTSLPLVEGRNALVTIGARRSGGLR